MWVWFTYKFNRNNHQQPLLKIITGLGKYFYRKCARQEKVRDAPFNAQTDITQYKEFAARLTALNKCLVSFSESDTSKKMVEPELDEIILYSIPNVCIKQAYLQGFYFKIPYNKAINMFECMDI